MTAEREKKNEKYLFGNPDTQDEIVNELRRLIFSPESNQIYRYDGVVPYSHIEKLVFVNSHRCIIMSLDTQKEPLETYAKKVVRIMKQDL